MQFDAVIGNPPYNNDLYLDFVQSSLKILSEDGGAVFVTPSKWQAKGGSANVSFRKNVVPHIKEIVHFPCCTDVFGISDVGGICYYSIYRASSFNQKQITTICGSNKALNATAYRDINSNLNVWADSIINKVKVEEPYTCDTELREYNYVITTPAAVGGSVAQGCFPLGIDGRLQVIKIGQLLGREEARKRLNESATGILYSADTKEECASKHSYIFSKFVRFLVFVGFSTLNSITPETWRFVPAPERFDHIFTDEELYAKFGLTQSDINTIESIVKERKN